MKLVIEYKGTTKSKFTFTKDEVRIKIADRHALFEDYFVSRANNMHTLLLNNGWTGITLRGNAFGVDSIRLNDSYKNKIATINNGIVVWCSPKGKQ